MNTFNGTKVAYVNIVARLHLASHWAKAGHLGNDSADVVTLQQDVADPKSSVHQLLRDIRCIMQWLTLTSTSYTLHYNVPSIATENQFHEETVIHDRVSLG